MHQNGSKFYDIRPSDAKRIMRKSSDQHGVTICKNHRQCGYCKKNINKTRFIEHTSICGLKKYAK